MTYESRVCSWSSRKSTDVVNYQKLFQSLSEWAICADLRDVNQPHSALHSISHYLVFRTQFWPIRYLTNFVITYYSEKNISVDKFRATWHLTQSTAFQSQLLPWQLVQVEWRPTEQAWQHSSSQQGSDRQGCVGTGQSRWHFELTSF